MQRQMPPLEEYKLAANHIEKLLDRRQSTTSFYLSVNTAIAAVIGLLLKDADLAAFWLVAAILLLLVAGFVACGIWRSLLHQYEILLDWWYSRLRELETKLAEESARLVTREYQELYKSAKPKQKIGLTKRELILNWLFSTLYVIFAVGIIGGYLGLI